MEKLDSNFRFAFIFSIISVIIIIIYAFLKYFLDNKIECLYSENILCIICGYLLTDKLFN